jgi:hypothetical protein
MSEFLTVVTALMYALSCIINVTAWTAMVCSDQSKEGIDIVRKEANLLRHSDWQIIAIGYLAAVTPYANMAFLHTSVNILKDVIRELEDKLRKRKA